MARKTKEEALKTREAIIDAAIQLFAEQGIFPTTLANIAEKAGVTRGAIYWHFKNKEALLDDLWEQVLLPFEPIRGLGDNEDLPDVLGTLEQVHYAFFKSLKESPRRLQLYKILMVASETVEEDNHLFSEKVCSPLEGRRKIENFLRNAVRRGYYPRGLNARLASCAIFSFFHGLVNTWILDPDLLDIDTDIPALLSGVTKMIHTSFISTEEVE